MKKIIINENQFKSLVSGNIIPLMEVNNNLTFREFNADMSKMGFKYRKGDGSTKVFGLPKGLTLTVHVHDDGSHLPADTLRQVKDVLEDVGWFNDTENFKLFPFQKWQIEPKDIKRDTTQQEIENANELYKDAEVTRVFYTTNNPLCVLKTTEGVNLCRNVNDRRPLLTTWFNRFGYDNRTNKIPCLKRENWETIETEAYPINQDGTLNTEEVIIENKKYGKIRII